MHPNAEGLVPVMARDWGLSQLMSCSMTWLWFCKVESKVIYCFLMAQKKCWREARVLKEVDKAWNNGCGEKKRML